jgi:hypothetical protein
MDEAVTPASDSGLGGSHFFPVRPPNKLAFFLTQRSIDFLNELQQALGIPLPGCLLA